MKNLMRFVMVAVAVSLISGAAYAKKDNDVKKADKGKQKVTDAASKQNDDVGKEAKEAKKKAEDKVKDANAAGGEKKSESKKFLGFAWGKDHKQQLKALDEKAAKVDAKNKEKIAALEKELAAAQTANDADKAAKLEKKLAQAKENAEKDMKKIEDKRAKIKAKTEE